MNHDRVEVEPKEEEKSSTVTPIVSWKDRSVQW